MSYDYKKHASPSYCAVCRGPGEGFKCPECGQTSDFHDPIHWRKCKKAGKMQVKCQKCGEAEVNCQC